MLLEASIPKLGEFMLFNTLPIPSEVFLMIFGLILLIKGGDWFVDASVAIAKKFGLPELLIGATVVSIGTTLPEVLTSVFAATGGSGEIASGNAIGSIICNTALIAAITVAIKPGKVDGKTLIFPVSAFFAVAAFYVGKLLAGSSTGLLRRTVSHVCAAIVGEVIMVGGYFAYESILYGVPAALGSLVGNSTQAVVGIVLATTLVTVIRSNKVLERVFESRK